MVQWSITASHEDILTNGPGFESGETLSLSLRCGTSQSSFFVRVPTWSQDLISYALFVGVLSSVSRDHGGGSGILRQMILCFRQMRAF